MEQECSNGKEQKPRFAVFSRAAYTVLEKLVFGKDSPNFGDFFATSTTPFQTWMTPYSFLYFCLTTHRCANCTRVFLTTKTNEEIRASGDHLFAAAILRAHELFFHSKYMFTYNQIADLLEICRQSVDWPTEHNRINGLLTEEEVDAFMANPETLDFALLDSANKHVLLRSHLQPNYEVDVAIVVSDVKLADYWIKQVRTLNIGTVNITASLEIVDTYCRFTKLIKECVNRHEEYRVNANDFL